MQMRMSCVQVQRQELQVRHEDEYLITIFKRAEEALNETDTQDALRFVASSKKMDSYESIMDFLFCEIAGQPWISRCRSFYAGRGLPARDIMTPEEIDRWDGILVKVLAFAVRCLNEERRQSWTKFRLASMASSSA